MGISDEGVAGEVCQEPGSSTSGRGADGPPRRLAYPGSVKKILLSAVAIACVAAGGVLLLRVPRSAPAASAPAPAPKFDAARWSRSTPRASGDDRLAMAKELMRTNALTGKARAEVLSQLGQGAYREPSGALRYELRQVRGPGGQDVIGTDEMLIVFGPDDRVSEVRHVTWHAGN
jgi:hypothetical protein